MGFPTANIEIDTHYKLIPVDAIYAVEVTYAHQKYGGMLYIGNRPTVNGTKRNIEVNIFNFNKDIYGEDLAINFIKLIRNDMKFEDLEALKQQLALDKESSLIVLKDFNN